MLPYGRVYGFRPGASHSAPCRALSEILAPTGRQGLATLSRHSYRRVLGQLLGVFLQLDEIVEGIDLDQFTGVDQAHEQVAHVGAVGDLIEQRRFTATETFP